MAEKLCVRDDPLLAVLVLLIAGFGGFAAWQGWMWQGPPPPSLEVVTVRGEVVTLFGEGVYRFNPVFEALAYRAQDAVMVLALAVALWAALLMRGARAIALLLAVLGYVFYGYASLALGAAFDWLFPAYVALMGLSLFALWRAGRKGAVVLSRAVGVPRLGLGLFLLLAGLGTFAIWGVPLLSALSLGGVPATLSNNTTLITYVLDLGVIVPFALVAAVMVLRGRVGGHVIALPLLGCILFLLPTILVATGLQMQAGFEFTLQEWAGPIGAFAVIGLIAGWFLRYYLLVLRDPSEAAVRAPVAQPA